MLKKNILVIADDLTGCGDIGYWALNYPFSQTIFNFFNPQKLRDFLLKKEQQVLLINLNSRSDTPLKAKEKMQIVSQWAFDNQESFDFIFKKLDSTLRGNWIAENEALIEELKIESLPIIAAYPEYQRITKNGYHYVDGQLLEETEFAISQESHIPTMIKKSKLASKMKVYDATNADDLQNIVQSIRNQKFFSGTSRFFGEILKQSYRQKTKGQKDQKNKYQQIIILAGSFNSITKKQLKYLDQNMKARENITIISSPKTFIRNYDLKSLLLNLDKDIAKNTLLICMGGDTAALLCQHLNSSILKIAHPIDTGIVLCQSNQGPDLILKPGGFGQNNFLAQICSNYS